MNYLRQVIPDAIGEGTARTFRVANVTVDDGAGGTRFLTAPEAAALTLRLTDHLDAVINGVDGEILIPDRGSYDTGTGVLLVTLGVADNPIIGTPAPGLAERHMVFVRLPGSEGNWVEILFKVQQALGI